MPTQAISAKQMGVGKKQGGKHWTDAEVAERLAAENEITRERVTLRVPDWLNEEARHVWRRIVQQTKNWTLLDNVDELMLANYCMLTVKFRMLDALGEMTDEQIKAYQAYARLLANYADKLGLTPGGRARWAKKKAEQKLSDFEQEFE
jgi:P27 family predicted phage terminase small subunit